MKDVKKGMLKAKKVSVGMLVMAVVMAFAFATLIPSVSAEEKKSVADYNKLWTRLCRQLRQYYHLVERNRVIGNCWSEDTVLQ